MHQITETYLGVNLYFHAFLVPQLGSLSSASLPCLFTRGEKFSGANCMRLNRPTILYELWTSENSLFLPGTEPQVPGNLSITLATILIEVPRFLSHRIYSISSRMFLLASKLFYIYTTFDTVTSLWLRD
jgi:hypothetical protein